MRGQRCAAVMVQHPAQAQGVTHSDDEEMHPPRHSALPASEPLSILKRPTTDPSSASTDATDEFLSKSAIMLGLHRTTTGSSSRHGVLPC